MTDTRRVEDRLLQPTSESFDVSGPTAPTVFVLSPSLGPESEIGSLLAKRSSTQGDTILEAHNRAMLAALEASVERPPHPDVPRNDELIDSLIDEAALSLKAVQGPGPFLVFDARFGVTFDLWRRVSRAPIGILVLEEPGAVAARARSCGANPIEALARYERVLHRLIEDLQELPVFVCDLKRARDTPSETSQQLVAFLAQHGRVEGTTFAEELAKYFVAQACERSSADDELVLEDLDALALALGALHGGHARFFGPRRAESAWAREVLRLSNELDQVLGGLLWTTRQIEPIVRAQPVNDLGIQQKDDSDSSEEINEYDENGPYPLSAGEDRRSYHRWLSAHRRPTVVAPTDVPTRIKARTRAPRFSGAKPLISVLVPIYKTPLWALERCVYSVLAQDYAGWQLCICDDASGDEELNAYLRRLPRLDKRISVTSLAQNSGISAATNAALAIAKGEFVAFLDHDDELTPDALSSVAAAIATNPEGDFFYSDEDKIDAAGERFDPAFKPEWSPDLLLSFAYLCHLTVIRRSLVNELGGLRSEYDGSQDYDLSLRATERARAIVHIPKVLYHWRTFPGSAATDSAGAIAKPWAYEAGHRAIEDALERRGEKAEVTAAPGFPGRYHVRRAITSSPLVSVIIPFRDEPGLLATCATSLRSDPGYSNLELVLVDNGSELPETEALLERLGNEDGVRILREPGPFNWAAINNAAAKQSNGEVLLFANNDIEARVPRWLDALLGHAMRKDVGAVGARLVYPDGAIQHAGVVIGLGGIAGHVLRGLPAEHPGYASMAIQTRNCSVVTGACMMTRAEVFAEVGGFDEKLPVAFNDVDYCLKLRRAGYLVVYTPLAELVHHESRSRGHTDDLTESKLILSRWADEIVAGDPYLNINLSHWRYWCPLSTAQEDERWKDYLKTSVLTRGSSSST